MNKYQLEAQKNLDDIQSILKQNQLSFQDILNLYDLISYNQFLKDDIFISITQEQLPLEEYECLVYFKVTYFGKESIYKYTSKLKDFNFYELVKSELLFTLENGKLKTSTQTIPYNFDIKISKIEFIKLFHKQLETKFQSFEKNFNNKVQALKSKEIQYNKALNYKVAIINDYLPRKYESLYFPTKIFERLQIKAGIFFVYELKPGYENYTEKQIKDHIIEKLYLNPIKELQESIKKYEPKLEYFKKQLDIISDKYSEYIL